MRTIFHPVLRFRIHGHQVNRCRTPKHVRTPPRRPPQRLCYTFDAEVAEVKCQRSEVSDCIWPDFNVAQLETLGFATFYSIILCQPSTSPLRNLSSNSSLVALLIEAVSDNLYVIAILHVLDVAVVPCANLLCQNKETAKATRIMEQPVMFPNAS
jgi:hypothetical protein